MTLHKLREKGQPRLIMCKTMKCVHALALVMDTTYLTINTLEFLTTLRCYVICEL
jgi:hypothetical protein